MAASALSSCTENKNVTGILILTHCKQAFPFSCATYPFLFRLGYDFGAASKYINQDWRPSASGKWLLINLKADWTVACTSLDMLSDVPRFLGCGGLGCRIWPLPQRDRLGAGHGGAWKGTP